MLGARGGCTLCDAVMVCPPHVCLRWGTIIGDEDGCEPAWTPLPMDHETRWRFDPRDPPPEYYR
jgi:hypothetical protein